MALTRENKNLRKNTAGFLVVKGGTTGEILITSDGLVGTEHFLWMVRNSEKW